MKIEDYIKLPFDERSSILWSKGTFLGKRVIYGKSTVAIYNLFNFYDEAYYSMKNNSIEDIKAIYTDKERDSLVENIILRNLLR